MDISEISSNPLITKRCRKRISKSIEIKVSRDFCEITTINLVMTRERSKLETSNKMIFSFPGLK